MEPSRSNGRSGPGRLAPERATSRAVDPSSHSTISDPVPRSPSLRISGNPLATGIEHARPVESEEIANCPVKHDRATLVPEIRSPRGIGVSVRGRASPLERIRFKTMIIGGGIENGERAMVADRRRDYLAVETFGRRSASRTWETRRRTVATMRSSTSGAQRSAGMP